MPDKTKTKARKELLEMAKKWDKEGKIQHAIESYEAIIEADPESEEADKAKEALIETARKFEKEGKEHSAFHLYHKLAEGRAGSHNKI